MALDWVVAPPETIKLGRSRRNVAKNGQITRRFTSTKLQVSPRSSTVPIVIPHLRTDTSWCRNPRDVGRIEQWLQIHHANHRRHHGSRAILLALRALSSVKGVSYREAIPSMTPTLHLFAGAICSGTTKIVGTMKVKTSDAMLAMACIMCRVGGETQRDPAPVFVYVRTGLHPRSSAVMATV